MSCCSVDSSFLSSQSSESCAGEGRDILESAEDVRVKDPKSDTHTRKTRP